MVHICYVIWQFKSPKAFVNMGGAERQLLKVTTELINKDLHHITIITRMTEGDSSIEKITDKVCIYRIFVTGTPIISMLLFTLLLPIYIIRANLREKIDIIHLPLPDFFIVSVYLVRLLIKVPVIARIAANELDLATFQGIWLALRLFLRFFILKMNAIQVLSPIALERAHKFNYPNDRLFFIPNGVVIPNERKRYDNLKNQLLYVGAMRYFPHKMKVEQKNLVFLINTFSLLSKQLPDLRLLMVGDGNFRPYLEELVKENKEIVDKVIFYGYQTDVLAFHMKSDIIINPSHFEGMPNSVIEAMASGLYVISSNIPVHQFLIGKNRRYGDLFNHKCESDLVIKVMNFYKNPTPYIQKAKNAREFINSTFSIEKIVKKWIKMYYKIIKLHTY